jgi:hypothetical protein
MAERLPPEWLVCRAYFDDGSGEGSFGDGALE